MSYGEILSRLDVEVQAWLTSTEPMPRPSDPKDIDWLFFSLPLKHQDSIIRSEIHALLEEHWYILYGWFTSDTPMVPAYRRELVELLAWIELRLGYVPEHNWHDEGSYENHLRYRHGGELPEVASKGSDMEVRWKVKDPANGD